MRMSSQINKMVVKIMSKMYARGIVVMLGHEVLDVRYIGNPFGVIR